MDRGPIKFSFHALVALLKTFFLLPLESNGQNHSPQLVLPIPLSCQVPKVLVKGIKTLAKRAVSYSTDH